MFQLFVEIHDAIIFVIGTIIGICNACKNAYAKNIGVKGIIIALAFACQLSVYILLKMDSWLILIPAGLALLLYIFAGGIYFFKIVYNIALTIFGVISAMFIFIPGGEAICALFLLFVKLYVIMACTIAAGMLPALLVPLNGFLYRRFGMKNVERHEWASND